MHQQPDPQVVAWSDDQPAESIWLSSITLFEVRYGLAPLPAGRRKDLLEQRFEELVQDDLQNRMLFFDTDAAARAAKLAADRKNLWQPCGHARHLYSRRPLGVPCHPGHTKYADF